MIKRSRPLAAWTVNLVELVERLLSLFRVASNRPLAAGRSVRRFLGDSTIADGMLLSMEPLLQRL